LIERATALYRDTSFGSVVSWKAAAPGRRAIGYLPVYVPRELIHAAGMLPVGVVGHGDLEIIRGDAYFQSYICHLPRSVIELALSGRLDALDGMIFPSTCDVIRNLSGMWKLLFPDRYAKYFDVPHNFDPEVGGSFYVHELEALRHDLEELGGRAITFDDLRASIAVYEENRRLVERLYASRRDAPALHPLSEAYVLLRAGLVLPVEEHNAMLAAYVERAPERDVAALDNIRVVVSGSFCEQPPLELVQTLERAGCYVVDDDLLQIYRYITRPVSFERAGGDPVRALADAFLHYATAAASLYQVDGQNGQALVDKVRRAGAAGVVFAAPSFCDPALLDQPMNAAALEREGIPYTTFKYAENIGQFQVIREQAGTFADSIRLWGEG
jgi:benzoyl-CoA reductase subunit C